MLGIRVVPGFTQWAVGRYSGRFIHTKREASPTSGVLFDAPASGAAHGGFRRGRLRRRLGRALGHALASR